MIRAITTTSHKSLDRPPWWSTLLPWRALGAVLPLATLPKNKATGLVVHRQGQYGWSKGNWVTGDPEGDAVHYGLDVIGWVSTAERSSAAEAHLLDQHTICCSPLAGLIAWVGPDEHGYPSINLWHSSRQAERRRFSFFGDLEEVYVKAGQSVAAGTPLGRPAPLRKNCRFFHFGMGYEIRRNGRWQDVYINPGPVLPGKIVVKNELPWRKR